MSKQAYGNPKTMMCETLVRSCAIRYMMSHGQRNQVNQKLANEENNGFLMVRNLIETLEKRELEAIKYATLADFMPEIIDAINNFEQAQGPVEIPDNFPKEYVDLDLEMDDGKKLYFATRNVGETSPGGIGSAQYRWGATIRGGIFWIPPETTFCDWPHGHRLDAEHDIATIQLGGDWHIPSPEEWKALIEQCDYERKNADESGYGVAGYFFYNKSDKTKFIFLPVSSWGNELAYWTSEIYMSENAYIFNSRNGRLSYEDYAGIKSSAFAVRPVIASDGAFFANGHDFVDLNIDTPDGKKLYFATMNLGETSPGGIESEVYRWGAKVARGAPWIPDSDDKRLDVSRDIATLTWGDKWHIPSRKEWNILLEYCDYERKEAYESGYGVAGYFFYNKSDRSKFIFLPVATWSNELAYWTSEFYDPENAYVLNCKNGIISSEYYAGFNSTGFAIRPVFVE